MATNSPINLGLPQTPRLSPAGNEVVHGEFQLIYNAVFNLWQALTDLVNQGGGGGEGTGAWGEITGLLSDQADLWSTLQAKLTDSPVNTNTYGRRNGAWVVIPAQTPVSWGDITGSITSQTDLSTLLSGLRTDTNANESDITSILASLPTKVGEAPANGKSYLRRNNAWYEYVSPVIPVVDVHEAPLDGKYYARRNGNWNEVPTGGGGGGTGGVLPLVTGIPPQLVYQDDGSLVYIEL